MKWLLFPVLVFLGMAGGQRIKGLRRFGIPGSSVLFLMLKSKLNDEKLKFKKFILLLLCFTLSIGYGVNSWLMKVFKNDIAVRINYALLLSIPFLFFKMWWSFPLLAVAYSIRAGGFKILGDRYDFLWEDFIRFSALSFCIIWIL